MLKRSIIIALFFTILMAKASSQTDEIAVETALHSLTDVNIISKQVSYNPYRLEYQLSVKQPVDHTDTAQGYFYQQIHLVHQGFDKPMVMETEGYNGRNGGNELEKILHCNDLNIEFRYFNKSKPDSLRWQYLTFEQATADLHHINQLFRKLYLSKWISTGISRGGETALTYKYFFPDDIDAVVPYVAPMPNDIEDARIYAFLDTAGGSICANKIKSFQVYMLKHEDEVLKKIPFYDLNLHYTSVGGIGQAYEYAVLEYPFSFWQITDLTEKDIPATNNLDTALKHLVSVFGDYTATFSDERNAFFIPHCYMTYQTGYYKYNVKPFAKYLHYFGGQNPTAAFLPPGIPPKTYDPEFEKKINAWLAIKGNNILYIYGGRDTWTACKAEFGASVNSKRFVIFGANHYMARIGNMTPAMQHEFGEALEQMTGLKADFAALQKR